MSNRRALLVVNSKATRGLGDLSSALARLSRAGIAMQVKWCRKAAQIVAAVEGADDDIDLIVIGGGDGTVSCALGALRARRRPFGLFPMGNANDFARTLGLSTNLVEAAGVLIDGKAREIDLGCVNGRWFLNIISLGVSVEVAKRLTRERKLRWGPLAYIGCSWEALRANTRFDADIICDGERHRLRCMQLSVGNGRYYGGGMTIVDDAAIDDSRLDLMALPPVRWWRALVLLPVLRWGRHRPIVDILSLHGRRIVIETTPTMAINVDGEIVARTPAEVTVHPMAIAVYAPDAGRDIHSRRHGAP